ncbi:hypothetical protein J4217_01250 [Candidatus Pacearchaeota archaeon]|nr:hypothetical protein [Candidatus Pacearchaeota archaeon]
MKKMVAKKVKKTAQLRRGRSFSEKSKAGKIRKIKASLSKHHKKKNISKGWMFWKK